MNQRKPAGRKAGPDGPKKNLSIRLTDKDRECLHLMATRHGVSMSDMVSILIKKEGDK